MDDEQYRSLVKRQDSVSTEDKKELLKLLQTPWFQRILRELVDEADEQRVTMTNMEMTSDDAWQRMISLQGRVRGLDRAFDRILEIAEEGKADE